MTIWWWPVVVGVDRVLAADLEAVAGVVLVALEPAQAYQLRLALTTRLRLVAVEPGLQQPEAIRELMGTILYSAPLLARAAELKVQMVALVEDDKETQAHPLPALVILQAHPRPKAITAVLIAAFKMVAAVAVAVLAGSARMDLVPQVAQVVPVQPLAFLAAL